MLQNVLLNMVGQRAQSSPVIIEARRLIYVEGPFSIALALQRERQLKRWSRAKKLALVSNQTNF